MQKKNNDDRNVDKIVFYLIFLYFLFGGGLVIVLNELVFAKNKLELIACFLFGGLGAIVYCMRGLYINYCALKTWDPCWWPWYVLRPLVGSFVGFVSYIFVKAGLPLLGAQFVENSMSWGLFALAVVAGYNVDNFLKKIENISESAFGIKPSRASKVDESNNNKENKSVD